MDFYHRKKCREKVYQMIKTSFVTILDWAFASRIAISSAEMIIFENLLGLS
jgi:hypothetical protein